MYLMLGKVGDLTVVIVLVPPPRVSVDTVVTVVVGVVGLRQLQAEVICTGLV